MSPYNLVANTANVQNGDTFSANVLNTQENVLFKLELSYLSDSTLRLRMNELNPMKQRYEPEQALVGEPKKTK